MSRLLDQFRGSMVGGLVGDCLGAVFEMRYENLVPAKKIDDFFEKLKNPNHSETQQFTDDTAMARQIAVSYIKNKSFHYKDLAERFTKEYHREPWRGYGGSVVDVFVKLQDQAFADPFGPASEQFNGSGSYGNGAGMRAHPVGLACHGLGLDETLDHAVNVGRLTHAHVHGIGGGVLQTLAVQQALIEDQSLERILEKIRLGVVKFESSRDNKDYSGKLDLVEQYLSDSDTGLDEISFELGNSVAALDSVPTALFCFLRCLKKYEKKDQFEQTIRLAIRMGGDTDTIASMAGAISGAYLGLEGIPDFMIRHCEAVEEAHKQGTDIHNIVTHRHNNSSEKEASAHQNGDTAEQSAAKRIRTDESSS